jgi:hypothetical protein
MDLLGREKMSRRRCGVDDQVQMMRQRENERVLEIPL